MMAVGLLLSVKVFCLNEITIRITTETKSCSTDPYCLYHKTLRNRTELCQDLYLRKCKLSNLSLFAIFPMVFSFRLNSFSGTRLKNPMETPYKKTYGVTSDIKCFNSPSWQKKNKTKLKKQKTKKKINWLWVTMK